MLRRAGRLVPRPVRRLVELLVVALVVEYLVLPQLGGTRHALHLLAHVHGWYVVAAAVLEVLSVLAYAKLTQAVLPRRDAPGLGALLRVQLASTAVSHCVPGGGAAGSSVGFRMLTKLQVPSSDAGFALATQSLGSALVLNVIFWLALMVSIPVSGFSPLYLSAAGVGTVLVAGFVVLVLLCTRGEQRAAEVIERLASPLPFVNEAALRRLFHQVASRLRELSREPQTLAVATVWAALNWLLDAASLYVFLGAFGRWVDPDQLLVAYGLANILAVIPITPSGLGVVEGVLVSSLVGFGTPRGIAILGVLAYRLINFWLPIPAGAPAYLSLHWLPQRRRVERGRSLAPAVDHYDEPVPSLIGR